MTIEEGREVPTDRLGGRAFGAAVHESKTRSLLKGLTWRVLATLTTVIIAWLITNDVSAALQIGLIEVFAKIAIYYLHERAWAHVKVGLSRPLAEPKGS